METKSKTCIFLSHIFLINANWYILSPSANKKVSHHVAIFYNVNLLHLSADRKTGKVFQSFGFSEDFQKSYLVSLKSALVAIPNR